MKICSTCGLPKTPTEYHRDVRNVDGLHNTCKACTIWNPRYEEHIQSVREKMCSECKLVKALGDFVRDARTTLGFGRQCLACAQMKLCRRCQVKKPLDTFRRSDRSRDGYGYRCNPCVNEVRREKYRDDLAYRHNRLAASSSFRFKKESREGRRERMLRTQYGLSLEDYDALLVAQDGKCKICLRPAGEPGRAYLVVDHDHETDVIRGLLCDSCNGAIGMLLESTEVIQRALEYVATRGKMSMSAHFG